MERTWIFFQELLWQFGKDFKTDLTWRLAWTCVWNERNSYYEPYELEYVSSALLETVLEISNSTLVSLEVTFSINIFRFEAFLIFT
ncbi:hypothetical protein RIR_jg989.t1 [Rhizophagus irregularis DAOM 181602=DAOM 197198]|nr:hypothetical protein RIR_jg989.t1 [Rhizophagus irregularis DAOM 181602=DAOM 197198]